MEMTILVQEFILPTVSRADVPNHKAINAQTQWSGTNDELVYLAQREQGRPTFEAGGLFFIGN